MDHDILARDNFEGKVEINLDLLRDQLKHDTFLDLEAEKPGMPW